MASDNEEAVHAATPAPADEFVGASETSSQDVEEPVKDSQGNDVSESMPEEDDAKMVTVDSTTQEDIEMNEEEKDLEEKEDVEIGEKGNDDVEIAEAKDELEKTITAEEEEEKTTSKDEEMAPAAARVEEGEETAGHDDPAPNDAEVGEKSSKDDVEMRADDETAHEANGESNDPASPIAEVDAVSTTNEDVVSSATAVSPAEQGTLITAAAEDTPPFAAKIEGSEQTDVEMQDCSKSLVPDCNDSAQTHTSETSNDANGDDVSVAPVAKKQKVAETVAIASENTVADESTAATDELDVASSSALISRDDMAKMEEDSGRLKFDVISNDGTNEHMIQLTTLKNIFAKQLPKMPKEYIVRLVFDKNHRSMLILKNSTHVIGGICYRPFEKNGFAEIAFCAINASDQVKGYGTRLMNHLKEYVKTKNITYFLTYADNYAIGYFKKQGFTKSVSMARPNWYGYIKDYDGGTLMECTIHTQINYLRITSMIHKQRKAIQDKIQERSHSKTVYAGLTNFAEGRLMDIYMVPGVKEAGWSQAVIRNNRIGTRDQGSLKSQLLQLLKAVSNHRSAWPFHEPVDTTVVVDYLDHIKEPVDLQLISKRIDLGTYISKAAFKADLDKMCENCMTYNTPDTNYYKAAMDLREFIQSRIQIRDHR